MLADILQRWDLLMTDEKKDDGSGLHVNVDGGFSISKQALWRTCVIIATMFSGGGVIALRLENLNLHQQVISNSESIKSTAETTKKELSRFRLVVDDVLNFLHEEKAQQKSEAAKKRYQEQIDKVRETMARPISQIPGAMARPVLPSPFTYPIFGERND